MATRAAEGGEGKKLAIQANAGPLLRNLRDAIRSARRLGMEDPRTDGAINRARQAYRELAALTPEIPVQVGRGRAWVADVPLKETGSIAPVLRGLSRTFARHDIGGIELTRKAGGDAFPPMIQALAEDPRGGLSSPEERLKEALQRACPGGVNVLESVTGEVGIAEPDKEEAVTAYMNALDQLQTLVEALKEEQPLAKGPLAATCRSITDLVRAGDRTLLALTQIKKEPAFLPNHLVNTAVLATYLGSAFGLPGPRLADLAFSSLLADVGMFFNAKFITDKLESSGEFNEIEWNIVKRHPLEGAKLILRGDLDDLTIRTLLVAFQHHHVPEMPLLAPLEEIDVLSRVSAIAQCYDDVTTPRPERPARQAPKALDHLFYKAVEGFLDSALVTLFARHIGPYPVGTMVGLTDGSVGYVDRPPIDPDAPDRPSVRVLAAEDGTRIDEERELAREEHADLAIERSFTLEGLEIETPVFVDFLEVPPA